MVLRASFKGAVGLNFVDIIVNVVSVVVVATLQLGGPGKVCFAGLHFSPLPRVHFAGTLAAFGVRPAAWKPAVAP